MAQQCPFLMRVAAGDEKIRIDDVHSLRCQSGHSLEIPLEPLVLIRIRRRARPVIRPRPAGLPDAGTDPLPTRLSPGGGGFSAQRAFPVGVRMTTGSLTVLAGAGLVAAAAIVQLTLEGGSIGSPRPPNRSATVEQGQRTSTSAPTKLSGSKCIAARRRKRADSTSLSG